jgi:prepilin-type N-terminal cleavage/methylation domain-containing protein
MKPRPAGRAGLSLIEVLLALAILGMGLAAIVAAGMRCVAVARNVRVHETVRDLITRVEVEKPIQLAEKAADINDSGNFEAPYSSYRWERTAEPIGLEEDYLFQVTTRILWSEGGRAASEEVVTYVLRPQDKLPGTAAR